jgi:hypothetical protein
MESRNAEPLQLIPEAVATVEAVLGVPLLPQNSLPDILPGDMRAYAYKFTLDALGVTPETATPDHRSIEQLQQSKPLIQLAMRLRAANSILDAGQGVADGTRDPNAARGRFQSNAMQQIIGHSQHAPITRLSSADTYKDGYLTVAPPGSGKTILQAQLLVGMGVGRPISERDPRIRTAVGIVGGRLLLQQQMDPDNTLQRFMAMSGSRPIPVGGFYTKRKNGHDEYPLILTTPRSYKEAVERKAIDLETTVAFTLDEAHEGGMAPSMQPNLPHFGSNLFMFTATPAIAGGRRDLRTRFPHSQFGSMPEFVHQGILSPVQLFTYRAGHEAYSAERIATQLAIDYVAGGRKTLVVCQPGNNQAQSRYIADAINTAYQQGTFQPDEHFGWGGDDPARAIGTFGDVHGMQSQIEINNLRQNRRLILTTVGSGKAGLDIPDLEALIIIGPQGAAWEVEQWLGRVLRPSSRIAIASEIFPPTIPEGRPLASIFARFGLENERIIAGYYIGPQNDESADPEPGEPSLSSPLPPLTSDTPASQPPEAGPPEVSPETPSATAAANTSAQPDDEKYGVLPPPSDLYKPPAALLGALVADMSIREATIAPADLAKLPPEDYKPLDAWAPEGAPIEWLYAILDKLDDPAIKYVGVSDWDGKGNLLGYQRHYSPAAHAYFAEHPLPQLAQEQEYTRERIAEMLYVPRSFVRNTIEALGVEPLRRISKYARGQKYYGFDVFKTVAEAAKHLERAVETDVTLLDLGDQTSPDYVQSYVMNAKNNIAPQEKWRHPMWGVRGISRHVSGEEAERIRQAYRALEVADPERFVSYSQLAVRASVSISQFFVRLNDTPPEAMPPIRWLRSAPKLRAAEFVDRKWGEAFAEYIAPERVLPWEITVRGLGRYFGKTAQAMHFVLDRRIKRGKVLEPVSYALPGVSETRLHLLSTLVFLQEEGIPAAPGMPIFDPAQAALKPQDRHDGQRVAYSQTIQSFLMSPDHLPAPDEVEKYWQRRVTPPTMPDYGQFRRPDATAAAPIGEDVLDTAAAQEYVGCDASTLAMLARYTETPAGTSPPSEQQADAYYSRLELNNRLPLIQDGAPLPEWSTIADLAEVYGESEPDVASMIGELVERRGYGLQPTEVAFFRINDRVTAYVSARTKIILKRFMDAS